MSRLASGNVRKCLLPAGPLFPPLARTLFASLNEQGAKEEMKRAKAPLPNPPPRGGREFAEHAGMQ